MIKDFSFKKYTRLLFYLWVYTLLVILWGAWVRISHSGDGCGDHWPLCAGQVVPDFIQKKTWIEYAHRLMSGLYGLSVIFIFIKIRISKVNSMTKKLSWFLLFFMISEALLGALLVKGQLVTTNDSVSRLVVMTFHQLNSFLLTGVTFLFYLSVRAEISSEKNTTSVPLVIKSYMPLVLFLLLAISGAVASLSTTLFPSISLLQGIMQDFSSESHLFVRLRIIHPALALSIASGFVYWLYQHNHTRAALEFFIAIFIGIITILTLSPVYLKLGHLLIAHLLWARLIYLFVNSPDSSKR